jgi:hypothetical protein
MGSTVGSLCCNQPIDLDGLYGAGGVARGQNEGCRKASIFLVRPTWLGCSSLPIAQNFALLVLGVRNTIFPLFAVEDGTGQNVPPATA